MNITIISDVHISDYPNYETYRYERLGFYLTYAKRIVEISKKNHSYILFIAGDLFDRPSNPPEINNVVRQVLECWNNYFDQIYYINGQHDLKTKNYDNIDNNTQSAIHAMATPKMVYVGHKILELSPLVGKIACMDFNAEPDLSWIKDKVDLFIGHVTINTSGFGSEIDYSKFKLGICGDIHYPCHKNNLHSVGVGVQRYMGDAEDGTCVIVDLDTLGWWREKIDPENKYFTRYRYTKDQDKEGPSEEKLENDISPKFYYIYKPEIITADSKEVMFDEGVDTIESAIESIIKQERFEDIHALVKPTVQIKDSVNFDFKLIGLEIYNIRSIDHHTIDFENKSGTLQIIAENGGGKSAIIWSLNYALRGGLDIRNEVREGKDWAAVTLWLDYQGKRYRIYRGTDGVELQINDQVQNLGGKRDTETAIREYLPFINYIDSYFFTDDSTRILGSYSNERKIELLSTYYRLDIIQSYYDAAWNLCQDQKDKMTEAHDKLNAKISERDTIKKQIDNLHSSIKSKLSVPELEDRIKSLQSDYDAAIINEDKIKGLERNNLNSIIEKNTIKINEYDKQIKDHNEKLSTLETELEDLRKKVIGIDFDKLSKDLDNYNKLDTKYAVEQNSFRIRLQKAQNSLDHFDEMNKIMCPYCNSEITLDNNRSVTKEDYQTEIDTCNTELENLNTLRSNNLSLINDAKEKNNDRVNIQYHTKDIESLKSKIHAVELNRDKYSKDKESAENNIRLLDSVKLGKRSSEIKSELDSYQSDKYTYDQIKTLKNKILSEDYDGQILILQNDCTKQENIWTRLTKYCSLFDANGIIYKEILNLILRQFSSDSFKYEAVEDTYRGKQFTNIIGYYKNYKMNDYREYSHCSNGQKTLTDLNFIKNLVTKAGVIVFDDFLGYLTTDNLLEGLKMIHEMNANLKIITSQNENSQYVDSSINLRYNGTVTEFV